MRNMLKEFYCFLICTSIAFLSLSLAQASDIAFYVGMWNTDGWYDASQFDDVEKIIKDTGRRFKDIQQFGDKDFPALEKWVKDNMKDGEVDIIWLNGCMPSVLYPFPNKQPDGSLAEEWLDNGNMLINVGDWFGYVSYECNSECGPKNKKGCVGTRCQESGSQAAASILDLSAAVVGFTDGLVLQATEAGTKYMPSIKKFSTDRAIALGEVKGDWEVAEVFASNNGKKDAAQADPVVLHNKKTNGYVAIINQKAGGIGAWIDRSAAVSDFIDKWVATQIKDFLAVGPRGKLTTSWGSIKTQH